MSSAVDARSTQQREETWTHPSVLALAPSSNPVKAITARARAEVFRAIQGGWSGPPYDPFALAEFLKISVEPRQDVVDARTIAIGAGRFRIEFNPNRSQARTNFSIAHEIAHTLFPDCAKAIRNRYTHADMKANDWQLEMLCNIGAAEILMPAGSFKVPTDRPLSIDTVLALQNEFSVSSESVLLRIAKLTAHECLIFAARRDESRTSPPYFVDYAASSRTWPIRLTSGFRLPTHTVAAQCTAIGFTAKAKEEWIPGREAWAVECVGVAPYPGHLYPRVVGIVRPLNDKAPKSVTIQYLRGDATDPRGTDPRILVQVVNDKAITWGKGFSVAVKKKWPSAQREFTEWVFAKRSEFKLGGVYWTKLQDSLELGSLIAQHGYGPSLFPRIQYSALQDCLSEVASRAKQTGASVHMPRIGSGEAGGDWNIVCEIVDEMLCREGIAVTVYDLPGSTHRLNPRQGGPLFENQFP